MLSSTNISAAELSQWTTSRLQEQILQVVCQNQNVTYDMLSGLILNEKRQPTEKTTIIVSAHTLAKRQLVKMENTMPGNPKSRVYIRATPKGAAYAILKFDIDYRSYLENYEENNLKELDKYITDRKIQRFIYRSMSQYYLERNLFDNQGRSLGLSKGAELELCMQIALYLVLDASKGKQDSDLINGLMKYLEKRYGPELMSDAKRQLYSIHSTLGSLINRMTDKGF